MKLAGTIVEYNSERFKTLFNVLFPSMCVLSTRIIKDEDKGKDIVQEAFVKLWQKDNEEFADENALRAYLYVLVKNACISHLRKEAKIKKVSIENQPHLLNEQTVIDEILREETYRLLKLAIDELSPQAANVVRLALKGYSNNEIGEELGITLNSVKTVKKRAYKILREKLGNQFVMILFTQLINFFQ